MRRYGVRILVAVLTFLLGVAFSFGVGLFRFTEKRQHKESWRFKRDCPKRTALHNHPFTIYNNETAPLQLTYLGPTSETASEHFQMLQILVENRSDRTISNYSLSGERFGRQNTFGFVDDTTNTVLKPGQVHTTLLPNNSEGRVELWLSRVTFEDGSVWNSARGLR